MKKEKDFSTRLMAFTFFYAVAIYTMFVGFSSGTSISEIRKTTSMQVL